jgi:hypothetical protein
MVGRCRVRLTAPVLLGVVVGCVATGCGTDSRSQPAAAATSPAPATVPVAARPRFFAPTSFWNAPLAPGVPAGPDAAALASALRALVQEEVQAKVGPWISTTGFSSPIYTVTSSQHPVRVRLDAKERRLQRAFAAVPLPANAHPASGSDAQLTVWQPSKDRLWEFWRLRREADGWHAAWGGAMTHVSQNQGVFTRTAWPGASSRWGATATSLPLVGGLITLEDLRLGHINHALALGLPKIARGVVRSPAQRTDGTAEGPSAIPAGTRFRLDPSLNLQSLALPRLVLMIAEAAQRYGIVVRDTSSVVDFYGEDPTPSGSNPYRALMDGEYLWQQLSRLPWDHIEAIGPVAG